MLSVVINTDYMSISASYGIQTFPAAPCSHGAGREGSNGCRQAASCEPAVPVRTPIGALQEAAQTHVAKTYTINYLFVDLFL